MILFFLRSGDSNSNGELYDPVHVCARQRFPDGHRGPQVYSVHPQRRGHDRTAGEQREDRSAQTHGQTLRVFHYERTFVECTQ